ncbi:MAG: FtsX-like permease family protein [Ruminiclostridium sp.]|nr:FtsX-like permease family protein [Ruminiclostridium sp.]
MKVLLKYTLKCLWQNKVRTGLILCAIMISSGMLFSSVSISQSLVKIQMDAWRSSYGYSDVIIHANSSSPTPYFYMNEALTWMPSCEYIIGELSGYGTLETPDGIEIQSSVRGIDWADLQSLTPVPVIHNAGIEPFAGGKIIIGKNAADRYNLSAGEILYLKVEGTCHTVRLIGIAASEGFFSGEGPAVPVLIPKDHLATFLNVPGHVDRIYLKLKQTELKYRLITKLSIPYKRYTVRESFSESEVKKQTDKIAVPIIIVAVILSFMSVFILYSAFKVIMIERLPVTGTFRSIGATIGSTRFILLLESFLYGIAGGFVGCGFGMFLLFIMSRVISNTVTNTGLPDFNPLYLLLSFAAAVFLSLAGALLPARKISRLPVKDLIFVTSDGSLKNRKGTAFFGFLLFFASLAIPAAVPAESGKWLSIAGIILFLASMVFLVPGLTVFFSHTAGWLIRALFHNEGFLALGQVRKNKNSHNNIALLIIGISGLFMVTTLNAGEMRQIADCFERCHYDMIVQFPYPNRNDNNLLKEITGVNAVLENHEASAIYAAGHDEPLYHVQGINAKEFPAFHTLSVPKGQEDILSRLDKGKNILLTTIMRDKWNLKAGDTLTLILPGTHGNKINRAYTILGFFDSFFPGRWSYALISESNFKRDIGSNCIKTFYIKSTQTHETEGKIKSVFARRKPDVRTIEQIKQEIFSENNQVFSILQFFSIITSITGIFGILNNMTISFIERERSLAIIRTIGMTRYQMMKMLFAEGCSIGLSGGLTGVFAGIIILFNIVPYVIKSIGLETRIYYNESTLFYCFAGGFVIPLLATFGPILRLRKMNLVSVIKM